MTFARRLELFCGAVVAFLELALSFTLIRDDYDLSAGSFTTAEIFGAIVVIALFYFVPGSLVVLGSYTHAVKQRSAGWISLMAGCVLVGVVFFLSLFAIAARKGMATLWGKFNFLVVGMAVISLIVSFVVQWQNRDRDPSST